MTPKMTAKNYEAIKIYNQKEKIFTLKGEIQSLKQENQQLKDIISKMCMELVAPDDDMSNGLADYFNQDLILEIYEVLK